MTLQNFTQIGIFGLKTNHLATLDASFGEDVLFKNSKGSLHFEHFCSLSCDPLPFPAPAGPAIERE
jgi:hypothetical protein